MLQHSLSKPQRCLMFNLPRIILRYGFALGVVCSVLFTASTAQAASCKLPKSYYKNVSCTSNSSYFLAIKDFGAPVALINKKGKAVVDLSRYHEIKADKIAGGLIPVQRGKKVGYINMQGREVVPVIYDLLGESSGWARAVSEGRIIVKNLASTVSLIQPIKPLCRFRQHSVISMTIEAAWRASIKTVQSAG